MPDHIRQESSVSRLSQTASKIASLFGERDCIAWIGSGISIGSGYPDWPKAIEELCDACIPGKADIKPSDVAEKLMEWAEQCKIANQELYFNTLGRLFGGLPNLIRTTYSLINSCPFRYLVTTNFDPCLEMVRAPGDPIVAYPNLNLFSTITKHTCVYLHGKARWGTAVNAKNLVLARSEFAVAYSNGTSLLPSLLDQLITHHNVLFVGCRLSEQIVHESLQRIKNIQDRFTHLPATRKMILLADENDPERERQQSARLSPLGIEILRYPLINDQDLQPGESPHRMLDDIWEQVWVNLRLPSDPFRQEGGLPS